MNVKISTFLIYSYLVVAATSTVFAYEDHGEIARGGGGRGGGGGGRGAGGAGRGGAGSRGGGSLPTMSRAGTPGARPATPYGGARPATSAYGGARPANSFSGQRYNQAAQQVTRSPANAVQQGGLRDQVMGLGNGNNPLNQNGNRIRNQTGLIGNRNGWFDQGFYDNHGYVPPYYGNGVNWWAGAAWASVNDWLPYGYNQPIYYEEGYPVTLSTEEESQLSKNQLPNSVAQGSVQGDWLPLGVYAIVTDPSQDITPTKFLQLALNKSGQVSGAYFNSQTDEVHAVAGIVDKGSQVVAFSLSDSDNSPIVNVGLYNLTQPQTNVRVLFPSGQMEERYLIRVQN